MIPNWSFGVREEDVQAQVDKARKGGAQLVVLLSHNGFDVDRKLAARVKGIDVILTGHTHDALPEAVKVSKTLLIASGSSGNNSFRESNRSALPVARYSFFNRLRTCSIKVEAQRR